MRGLLGPAGLLLAIGLAPPIPSLPAQRNVAPDATVRRVGYLGLRPMGEAATTIVALKDGLRALGRTEGRDYVLEVRLADNDASRYPGLITELTNLKVELIVAASTPAAVAIHKANPTMPIVVGRGPDIVGAGLARSLERPGGLATGIEELNAGNIDKSLRILREAAPTITRVAVLSPAPTPGAHETQYSEAEQSATQTRPYAPCVPNLGNDKLSGIVPGGVEGTTPGAAGSWGRAARSRHRTNRQFARSERQPAVYPHELYAERGGLIAYSADNVAMFRLAATYVDKILKGGKPGDLPLTRWTRENVLLINMRTADAMGMALPPGLLSRAGRIIR